MERNRFLNCCIKLKEKTKLNHEKNNLMEFMGEEMTDAPHLYFQVRR